MASLRRTKNFANDGQTPIFLYTILKQLDLRSIDWNLVASSLDISNGHAARMRYSRMRGQFEGLSNQPKAPKARKEKDGESKASKEKAKGKRLLLEEENERLAKQRTAEHNGSKKARLEPSPYIDTSAARSMMNTGQQYVSPMWSQPIVKLEPSSGYPSLANNNPSCSTVIKKEPDTSATSLHNPRSTSPVVKQEPATIPMANQEVSAAAPSVVKKESDAVVSHGAFAALNAYNSPSPATSYRLSNLAGPYMNSLDPSHYMNSLPLAMVSNTTSSAYPMPQTTPGYTYHPFLYHNAGPWAQSIADHNVPTNPIAPTADNMTLNPLANSYEELLNLPLYVRQAGPTDVQPPAFHDGSHALAQSTDNKSDYALHGSRSVGVTGLGTNDHTVEAVEVNPVVNSNAAESLPDGALSNLYDASSAATIEIESDAECEVETDDVGMGDGDGRDEETEPVEAW
ncbi:hypothetical protein A1O3_06480 [Capronia epimyces CBS 606.96]|uniref:Myb-like DNA-binding domain-containing protein n=1 Tax=Capronia epimyces CBS 606.96 TaxID=1182542 RepID=W9Y093_9EURO|nr:uncharacterized protein A1O3_06480 [Capronia epimyces CBS 606.96]EXJ82666.1 hypothetical protein A1O3_06480 [Capronia epimyces CBS 606.96]